MLEPLTNPTVPIPMDICSALRLLDLLTKAEARIYRPNLDLRSARNVNLYLYIDTETDEQYDDRHLIYVFENREKRES